MKSVADQIHSMGLKFGLYGDAGTRPVVTLAVKGMKRKTLNCWPVGGSTIGSMIIAIHLATQVYSKHAVTLLETHRRGTLRCATHCRARGDRFSIRCATGGAIVSGLGGRTSGIAGE